MIKINLGQDCTQTQGFIFEYILNFFSLTSIFFENQLFINKKVKK